MLHLRKFSFLLLHIAPLLLLTVLPLASGALPEAERSALVDFAQKTGYASWAVRTGWTVSLNHTLCLSFLGLVSLVSSPPSLPAPISQLFDSFYSLPEVIFSSDHYHCGCCSLEITLARVRILQSSLILLHPPMSLSK